MKKHFFGLMMMAAMLVLQTVAQTTVKPKADAGGEIKFPSGFAATVFAKQLGNARHIVVNSNGDVYVKLGNLKGGKGIVKLKDTNGDGVADDVTSFASYAGTGIAIKNGYLYASSNTEVYRYRLNDDLSVADPDKPERIVKGLLDRGQHNSKSITLDNAGNIYVNIGAYSNSCQIADRTNGSLGKDPCPILDSAGGIWQFKADKPDQSYGDGVRYATGLRNVVGLDWNNEVNELYVMQHGRDQIASMFPNIYKESEGAELPAEEFFEVKKGTNGGWPYCYFNPLTKQKLLNPEYGGDGKTVGRCDIAQKPLVGFPAHMAPNGLLFYTGKLFPEKYRNGAFIAFHGSWNRSPQKQEGFYVAFQPLKDGQPSGDWEVFADGFAGRAEVLSPGQATYRPCGLAQGPDGALYITDDVKGTVWKVTYK
jgi:glucose/arabinose dehydrogenase